MKIGLGSFGVSWSIGIPGWEVSAPWDAWRVLRFARELNLDLVQMADNCSLFDLSRGERARFVAEARDSGMQIEVGGRGLTRENLRRHLELAREVDARMCRMVIDGPGYEPGPGEVVVLIHDYIKEFEDAGITLALENHDRLKAEAFAEIIEAVASPSVGICLDTVNSLGCCEGLEHVVKVLAPYTVNLHIKDYSIHRASHGLGFVVEGAAAGDGMLPVGWLISHLRTLGRCRTAILENWTIPAATANETALREQEWCRRGAQFLRGLMPRRPNGRQV